MAGRDDDDLREVGRGGQEDELAATRTPLRLPFRKAAAAGSPEHDNAVRFDPLRYRVFEGVTIGPFEALFFGRREGRLVEFGSAVAPEAGLMSCSVPEGEDQELAAGRPVGCKESVRAVPLRGMEGMRCEAAHPMAV